MSQSRVGTQFGHYRLDELIGRGGMGEVYRAFDTAKDRPVALKLLNPSLAADAVYQERFRRESRAVARLGEPHIIPIHDFGDLDGVLFLDMRLVHGRDLRKVLTDGGALRPARTVAIIAQIAEALDAAHADGLVHRDVKPENILLTDADFAYLVDFGIAQADSSTHLTQTGSTIGSFAYMAPELFDDTPASPASDIYALTAVMFECLTGRVPHPAGTVSSAIKAAVLSPTPTLSSVNADLPVALESVVARGLAKDPAQRYTTAAEFARDARAAVGTVGSTEPTISLVKSDDVATAPAAEASSPTEVIGTPAPGAYDVTQYGVPVYPQTVVRSGPVPPMASAVPGPPPPGYQPQPQPVGSPAYGPPAGGYPPQGYPPPRRQRSPLPILAAVAVVLLVVLGVVIAMVVSSGNDTSTAGPSTVTQVVTSQAASAVPTAPVAAPESTPCDASVGVATTVTSCPFAFAVRDEYLRTGSKGAARTVTAFSPVTGASYAMACTPAGSAVVCRGGNNAVVVIY